jgi:hypothetical protein
MQGWLALAVLMLFRMALSNGWIQTRFRTGLISPNPSTKLVRFVAHVTSLLGRSPFNVIRGVNSLTHVLGVASVGVKGAKSDPSDSLVIE